MEVHRPQAGDGEDRWREDAECDNDNQIRVQGTDCIGEGRVLEEGG